MKVQGFTLKYGPRAENLETDELVKAASNNLTMLEGTFFQELVTPTTTGTSKAFKEILVIESEDWRQLIIDQRTSLCIVTYKKRKQCPCKERDQ